MAVLVAMGIAVPASAVTVAQWRFENGTANTDVTHIAGAGNTFSSDILDVSGNGNHLSTWITGGCCGYQYRGDVPFANVPQTGAANNLSVKNTGGGPGMFTNSAVSVPPGVNIETMMPTAFTVEVSWKPENGGYRTVVGRDAQNVVTSNGALAALYVVAQPDNSLAIKFADAAGNFHEAVTAPGFIDGFDFPTDPDGLTGNWYNIAAVSNGELLRLYVNGEQVALSEINSADPRLAIGTTSGGDWHAGEWSVGRGLYGGGHTDRAYGFIDEVRISNHAIAPGDLLVPVPATLELTVNKITGAVTMKNNSASPISANFYGITSDAGALSLAGWSSLDNQNYDAVDGTDPGSVPGDSDGEGWDAAGGSNANQLIELFLAEAGSSIGAGETLNLGNAFNTSIFGVGNEGDLEFSFGLVDKLPITGKVTYVTGGVLGDYNNNGVVDAGDYVLWRKGGPLQNEGDNPGVVNAADYTFWRSRFGATSGSGAGMSPAAVPEPSVWTTLLLAATALCTPRRRHLDGC
jgi:hypothetical protein